MPSLLEAGATDRTICTAAGYSRCPPWGHRRSRRTTPSCARCRYIDASWTPCPFEPIFFGRSLDLSERVVEATHSGFGALDRASAGRAGLLVSYTALPCTSKNVLRDVVERPGDGRPDGGEQAGPVRPRGLTNDELMARRRDRGKRFAGGKGQADSVRPAVDVAVRRSGGAVHDLTAFPNRSRQFAGEGETRLANSDRRKRSPVKLSAHLVTWRRIRQRPCTRTICCMSGPAMSKQMGGAGKQLDAHRSWDGRRAVRNRARPIFRAVGMATEVAAEACAF